MSEAKPRPDDGDIETSAIVHAAGVCVLPACDIGTVPQSVLLLRRSGRSARFPGLWEGGGGRLQRGETFAQAVKRLMLAQTGLKVRVFERPARTYDFSDRDERGARTGTVCGVRLLCRPIGSSPDRIVLSDDHTDAAWVSAADLASLPNEKFIPGVKREILTMLAVARRREARRWLRLATRDLAEAEAKAGEAAVSGDDDIRRDKKETKSSCKII